MYTEFAYATDGQGPVEPISASEPLLQTAGSESGLDLASEASWLTGFRKRGCQVPNLKLSIIMAAFNEQETIEQAISEILEIDYPCGMELIVIDDGSKDETPNLLAAIDDPRVIVFRHEKNMGKGAAILTGVSLASGTHILPFDADLEYTPEDIPKILEPVLRGRCSVVFGVRLFGYNTVYRSYVYALGNRMLTRITNIMFGACLSDLHTCLKLLPTTLFQSMRLSEAGFGLDTEISASLLRCGVRPFEVPVSYFSRSHEEGKKITWRDAFACLWILIRVRTLPRSRLLRAGHLSERDNSDRAADLKPGAPRNLSGRAITMGEADTMSIGLVEAD